jgi:hypothetical protein
MHAGFALRGHSPEKDCSIETSTDSTEFLFFDFDWTRLSESPQQYFHVFFLLVNGSCRAPKVEMGFIYMVPSKLDEERAATAHTYIYIYMYGLVI